MSTVEPFALGNLHGFVDLPDEPGERPAVVLCHGFQSFMEWGFFPYLAELLADRGFVVVRFDAGMADLSMVLEATGASIAPGRVDRGRLGLFGHGEGGASAILAAAGEPRVRALVTWAAAPTFDAGDLDILAAARTLRAPWLIVHGEEDESDRLAEAASNPHELLRIPGASHTFGARHPFVGPTPHLIQAMNATQRWFRRYLG